MADPKLIAAVRAVQGRSLRSEGSITDSVIAQQLATQPLSQAATAPLADLERALSRHVASQLATTQSNNKTTVVPSSVSGSPQVKKARTLLPSAPRYPLGHGTDHIPLQSSPVPPMYNLSTLHDDLYYDAGYESDSTTEPLSQEEERERAVRMNAAREKDEAMKKANMERMEKKEQKTTNGKEVGKQVNGKGKKSGQNGKQQTKGVKRNAKSAGLDVGEK